MEKAKQFYRNYKHILLSLGYMLIYLSWFFYLEKTVTRHFTVIHVALDDYIPFCEIFVIPYLLWFGYVAAVVVYLMLHNRQEYYRACAFLFTGMTIFLVISTLWPNGQYLRPFIMPRDNIFTRMVASLYLTDTPMNLWPSIHVYNSLGAHFAIVHSRELGNRPWLKKASFVLCVLIILSTMFLKQHSVFDVITAFFMAAVMYQFVYNKETAMFFLRFLRDKKKIVPQIRRA